MNNFAAFVSIAALVIITPGPDTALAIRNTLLGGRRGGILTGGGVATAQAVWALATCAGLAALLQAFSPVYLVIRLIGAAYLVFLGAHSVWNAWRRRETDRRQESADRARLSGWTAYRQGLLSNFTNPKMAVFFISLLPQFAGPGPGAFFRLLVLGSIFCAMTFTWLFAYAFVVARIGTFLRRDSVRRLLDSLTGVVLIGLGIRIAANHG